MNHTLKCKSEYFQATKSGLKMFEVRRHDRNFKEGDTILLVEIDDDLETGDGLHLKITYFLRGGIYGISDNYCVLGVTKV